MTSSADTGTTVKTINIIIKNSGKYFYDYKNYEQLKSNKLFNIHQYDKLFYIRHKLTDMQLYMEMKGKLIFEFLYFGKKVHYSPDNKMFDDGLTDYFQLFNIDDNIEQDIHINKKEIYNKLIQFDDNDDYLKLINSL